MRAGSKPPLDKAPNQWTYLISGLATRPRVTSIPKADCHEHSNVPRGFQNARSLVIKPNVYSNEPD
jgi:hypothetical protein